MKTPRCWGWCLLLSVVGIGRVSAEVSLSLRIPKSETWVLGDPIPLKWAMARMGLCGGAMRLPMTPLSQGNEAVVEGALRETFIVVQIETPQALAQDSRNASSMSCCRTAVPASLPVR